VLLCTGEMMSVDGRGPETDDGDASVSIKSDSVEVDEDVDEDDIGIIFTVPVTASAAPAHEGKYCLPRPAQLERTSVEDLSPSWPLKPAALCWLWLRSAELLNSCIWL